MENSQLERIAIALERIADGILHSSPSPTSTDGDDLAIRRINGENVAKIGRSIGLTQSGARARIMKSFERRNPDLFNKMRRRYKDPRYSTVRILDPDMRDLVKRCKEFGFNASDKDGLD